MNLGDDAAVDPFCNPVFGLPKAHIRDTEETLNFMIDNRYIDSKGAPVRGSEYDDFMKACVARDELFGWDGDIDEAEDLDTEGYDSFYTEDEDGNLINNDPNKGRFDDPGRNLADPGADCALGKTFQLVDNVWFYNYAYRYRVNALMDEVNEETAPSDNAGKLGDGELGLPIRGATQAIVTSGFGPRWGSFHDGIDFGVPTGTKVYASVDGTVREVYTNCTPGTGSMSNTCGGGAGNYVKYVSTDGKYEITVMHGQNVQPNIVVGASIKAGDELMEVDHTGQSTAAHLHYRLHVNGAATDPTSYLWSGN
jgi:murein DD-endopeptidase MepM/ murein hydrolase activator NlpD